MCFIFIPLNRDAGNRRTSRPRPARLYMFMKTAWYKNPFLLFLSNLKYRTLARALPADKDLSKPILWRDFCYLSFFLWSTVIKAKLQGEIVPGYVLLVGGPLSVSDFEWAINLAKELGFHEEE